MKKEGKAIIIFLFVFIFLAFVSAEPSNKPYCFDNPVNGWSWYDDGGPIMFDADCEGCVATYKTGELPGWYSSCDNNLIEPVSTQTENSFFVVCDDTDGGENHFMQGVTSYEEQSLIDYCVWDDRKPTTGLEGTRVVEHYCDEENKIITSTFSCPYGCENGACTKVVPTNNTPEKVVDSLEKEGCYGCLVIEREESKCYPFGYITPEEAFCSGTDNLFIEQKGKDSLCENNYECLSNICEENACKNISFIKRILNWFKNIF